MVMVVGVSVDYTTPSAAVTTQSRQTTAAGLFGQPEKRFLLYTMLRTFFAAIGVSRVSVVASRRCVNGDGAFQLSHQVAERTAVVEAAEENITILT